MSFHYHLTIANCTAEELQALAKTLRAKATTIDLENDVQSQKDRMITKYGKSLELLKEKALSDTLTLEASGYSVTRIKIEEVVSGLLASDLDNCLYLEGHLRVPATFDEKIEGFHLSKNPSSTSTKFYNFRIRTLNDYNVIQGNFPHGVLEAQFELVHIDTNEQHDRWWA